MTTAINVVIIVMMMIKECKIRKITAHFQQKNLISDRKCIFSCTQHDGKPPLNYKEKDAFKKMLREG